jgi:hypothetical protein
MSSSTSRPDEATPMDLATAPISTTRDYYISIWANRRRENNRYRQRDSVYIDNVEFVDSPCERFPPTALPDCYSTRPTNCSFRENSLCGWRDFHNAWSFVKAGGRPTLHADYRVTGSLGSHKSCFPGEGPRVGCLSFKYGFEQNGTVVLRVVIFIFSGFNSGNTVTLWSTSNSEHHPGQEDLDIGRVPISLTYDYYVSFEIYKRDGVAQIGQPFTSTM